MIYPVAERDWSTAWEESSHIQLGCSWEGGCRCHIWQRPLRQPKIQYYVKCVTSQQYICGVQYLKFTQLCWQQRMFGPEPFKGVFYKTSPFQNDSPKPIPKLSLHLKGLLIDAFVAKVCGEVPHFHHLCLAQRRGDFILVSNDFMVTWLLTNWFIGINVSKSISTGLETHAFWHNKLANFFHWKTQ